MPDLAALSNELKGLPDQAGRAPLGGVIPGLRELDGMYSLFLYSLCRPCVREGGFARMLAEAQSHIAARDPQSTEGVMTRSCSITNCRFRAACEPS